MHARVPHAARRAQARCRLGQHRRLLLARAHLPGQGRAALRPLQPARSAATSRASTRCSTSARRDSRGLAAQELAARPHRRGEGAGRSAGRLGQADGDAKARLAEQSGRHQGGSKWIGTGGTSPVRRATATIPEGVRIGQERGRHAQRGQGVGRARRSATSTTTSSSTRATSRSRCGGCGDSRAKACPKSSTSTAPSRARRSNAGWLDLHLRARAAQSRQGAAVPRRRRLDGPARRRSARSCSRRRRASSATSSTSISTTASTTTCGATTSPAQRARGHARHPAQVRPRLAADLRRRCGDEPVRAHRSRAAASNTRTTSRASRGSRACSTPSAASIWCNPEPERALGVHALHADRAGGARPAHVSAHARRPGAGHRRAAQVAAARPAQIARRCPASCVPAPSRAGRCARRGNTRHPGTSSGSGQALAAPAVACSALAEVPPKHWAGHRQSCPRARSCRWPNRRRW